MAYDTSPNSASSAKGVPLGSRVEIFPSQPLADLNTPGAQAFGARVKDEANADAVALLCNANLFPRLESVTSLRSIDHPSLLRLVDSGVVLWPGDDTRHFALIYQRPQSPRFVFSNETFTPLGEDAINHHFVTPMIGVLAELVRTSIVHGAIRPNNIFWRAGSATPPQLGDCLSVPTGYGQPALFETIERSMSTPLGRGQGIHTDDCYAFGVVLALLVLGHNPLQGADENAVIQAKVERGTFGALVGNHRLPAIYVELLRGLLTDDGRQRWTASDLQQWVNGRRLTPKNADAGRRATRFFEFNGKEYWQLRPLAMALPQNPAETVRAIESGQIDKWLKRALNDEERANDLAETLKTIKESGKITNYEEQVVARVSMALDPPAPLRYRGLAVMPGGIATMLVEAILSGNNIQALSEIISTQLVTLWVEMQKETKTELVPMGQQFERMKGLLEKSGFGNGVERVLYELNSGLPCVSPIVRSQYVVTPKALLPALERIATSPNRPREPMDRHIAAFLIVRDRRNELLFESLALPDASPRKGVALLTLFSDMQHRHGPDSLPHLAQWLVPFLEISIRRYFGKTLREKLQQQLKETAGRGDLSGLLRLVDDPRRVERDQQEFMAARMLYLNILKEIASIEGKLANRELVIKSVGKPMAASLSSFLAIILILITLLRAIW